MPKCVKEPNKELAKQKIKAIGFADAPEARAPLKKGENNAPT